MKRKYLFHIFTLCFFYVLTVSPVYAQEKLGIAAVVNDDIITHSDVYARIELGLSGSNMANTPENRARFYPQALNSLIEEQIRMIEAERLNIQVQQDQIDAAITSIAQQNNVDPQFFRETLSQTPRILRSLEQQLRSQISWSNVIRQRLRPQINITEADIDNFINDVNKNKGKSEYRISEIVLRYEDSQATNDQKKLAGDLVKELKNGAPFFRVAQQFSQGKEARNGGAIGWVLEEFLDPKVQTVVQTMNKGDISKPIETDEGIKILLLHDKRIVDTRAAQSKEINLKQILIPVPAQARDEINTQAIEKANQLTNEITNCKVMDEWILKQENPMSRDLGYISEMQLPTPILDAVSNAKIDQILPPISVEEGLLLLMVCGVKDSAQSETIRDQIANKIGAERLERLQQRYLRDLRATTYIDIRN